jgi:hypothetical protein
MVSQSIVRALKADRRVEDVEDEGMDEGRFFVHLRPGFDWGTDPFEAIRTKSFGSFAEAHRALKRVKVTP